MIRATVEPHGDVTRVRLSHWRSRAVGYEVSVYVTRGVMIDSGFPAAAADVVRLARERSISAAMITHHHEDHSGGAPALAAAAIPLMIPPEVARLVRAGEPIPVYRRIVWGSPAPLGSVTPANSIPGLELLPAPGHSHDHHVVWDAERRTLFAGDLFLGVKVRVAHPEEDPRLLVETLRRFAALEPVRLFDAHRGAIANPAMALRRKADWIEEIIGAVDDRVARGWSDDDIRRELLGRESFSSYVSRGEYGKKNLVTAIRRGAARHH